MNKAQAVTFFCSISDNEKKGETRAKGSHREGGCFAVLLRAVRGAAFPYKPPGAEMERLAGRVLSGASASLEKG